MADTYFGYKPSLLDRLTGYVPNMKVLGDYFGMIKIISVYEDPKNRIIHDPSIEHGIRDLTLIDEN